MTYVTARERQLLKMLLEQDTAVPVSRMAKSLGVSTRTVHRDLAGLEQTLEQFGLSLKKKTGKGIFLEGNKEQRHELALSLIGESPVEYTTEERKVLILSELLTTVEPVKLSSLAHDLKVSSATISHDLDQIEDWLASYDLALIRRRGFGVKIKGSESSRRQAMSSLLVEHFDESSFHQFLQENIKNKSDKLNDLVSSRLLGMVDHEQWQAVDRVLAKMNDELPYSIADSAYIGLVVHLTLAIERMKQGEKIEMEEAYLLALQSTKEFDVAKKLGHRLETVFHIQIPDAEIGYITMHLRGAKLRHEQQVNVEPEQASVAFYVTTFIQSVEKRIDQTLRQDQSLFQGLVAHLEPALYRIQEKMKIHNPLLQKIKADYPALFQLVREAAGEAFAPLKLPEEEVGFLALHIGSALEKRKRSPSSKALVVCSSGIGSSKMLVTRLEKEIPELKELKNISLTELTEEEEKDYDLIISTLPLRESDHIVVNPFLTEQDVENIRTYLQSLEEKKGRMDLRTSFVEEVEEKKQTPAQQWKTITQTRRYLDIIEEVIEQFTVRPISSCSSLMNVIHYACRELAKKEVIHSPEEVTSQLIARHEKGGVAIPNSTLALFHARSESVYRPSFTMWSLESELELEAMNATKTNVSTVMILLAPAKADKETYQVLSELSGQMTFKESSLALYASEEEESIRHFMIQSFYRWIQHQYQ